jgi:tetratricopeptide (TPR) repeat protein
MRKLLLFAAVFFSACAPAIVPPPVVTSPKFPEFVRPAVPPAFARSASSINEERGWAFLQSGDLKTAEHEFRAALKNDPQFFPAEASLGYIELARKDAGAALTHFDKALEHGHEVGTLIGRGHALLALDRDADALTTFESVLTIEPGQADIRRQVDVLKFRGLEQEIANARGAARAGRTDEAIAAYSKAIAGQPDTPFLYRELAVLERQSGNVDGALEHFRKAVDLDATDARSRGQIGQILEGQDDIQGAMQAYTDAIAIEPDPDIERRLDALKARVALERLPAEYRAIEQSPQITRADLAALIGIRLAPLLEGGSSADAALITDVRTNWAQSWIMAVARAGVMEPFANHQFQPRALVRRSDLALAAARLLTRIGAQQPDAAKVWQSARGQFSDLSPGHLAYPAASVAVAAGVMSSGQDNTFQPSRPVSGAEAMEAVAKLESLSGSR